MRRSGFYVRLVFASCFALLACAVSAQRALADTCPVDISFVDAVPNTHEFAIEFGSTIDGVADLRWTMYAGDQAYTARFSATTFTATVPPSPRSILRWHSAPIYVRLPDDAPPPTAATVEVMDPASKAPVACSGGRWRLGPKAEYVPDPNAARDPATVARRDEARRAIAGAALATPTIPDRSAVAPLTCAEPFENARVTKAYQASYPLAAQYARATGLTFVLVEIAPTNDVVATAVIGASGSRDLDEAARSAAVKSTYRAERFRCALVSGEYLFQVDFGS